MADPTAPGPGTPATSDELAAQIRAVAFNAVGPALDLCGDWLRLGVRQAVADAVLAALSAAGYRIVAGFEDSRTVQPGSKDTANGKETT